MKATLRSGDWSEQGTLAPGEFVEVGLWVNDRPEVETRILAGCLDGFECYGHVEISPQRHTLVSRDPLHIEASIFCRSKPGGEPGKLLDGCHYFVRGGEIQRA